MSTFDMNAHLRGKYRHKRPVMGYPARARTDNTGHPLRSKMPALRPCKRAPAGVKVFEPAPQRRVPGVPTLVIDLKNRTRRMERL